LFGSNAMIDAEEAPELPLTITLLAPARV